MTTTLKRTTPDTVARAISLRSNVAVIDKRAGRPGSDRPGAVLVIGPSARVAVPGLDDDDLDRLLAARTDWFPFDSAGPVLQAIYSRHPGLFSIRVTGSGGSQFIVEALADQRVGELEPSDSVAPLCRFTFMFAESGATVVESPRSRFRLRITDAPSAHALADIACGRAPVSAVAREVNGALHALGFIAAEPEPAELVQWEFHDLLFHTRSRTGNTDAPFGGIFPYRGIIEPEPAVKPLPSGRVINLPGRLGTGDDPLTTTSISDVVADRRSIRRHGEAMLDTATLGAFLDATLRVKSHHERSANIPYDWTRRPYPSGGASYELEFYLTVARSADIEPGTYYYDPVGHRLVCCSTDARFTAEVVERARMSTAWEADPDIVVSVTARFRRMTWKYRGLAYSAVLKHVGVVYQTFYLAATAMGIGPCALGSGDARTLSDHLGLDYHSESGVGEFILSAVDES